jgi:hypothetical protein
MDSRCIEPQNCTGLGTVRKKMNKLMAHYYTGENNISGFVTYVTLK